LLHNEIAIQQKDKTNMMIDEGEEFSLKDSLLKMERKIISQTMQNHCDSQIKTTQAPSTIDE
jgi:hypothetical protein